MVEADDRVQWVLDRLPESVYRVVFHIPVELTQTDDLTGGTCNFGKITVRLGPDDNLEFVLAHEYLHAFVMRAYQHPRLASFQDVMEKLFTYLLNSEYYKEGLEQMADTYVRRHLSPSYNPDTVGNEIAEEALADSLADLVTGHDNKNPEIRSYGLPILENFLYYALDLSSPESYERLLLANASE